MLPSIMFFMLPSGNVIFLSRTEARAQQMAAYGEGTGSILLDDVNCLGTESSIWQCSANPLGIHDCGHSEDAGVVCGGECV